MHPSLDVTIVMPAYNRSKLIRRALDSVRTQSHWPREVIVVDDASTDDTVEQVLAWSREFGVPTRVERLARNGGPAVARNRGIELAATRYVCFLDSDDEQTTHTLEKLVAALEANPSAAAAFADATRV